MSPVVVKEKVKSEKRKKSDGEKEAVPPTKQVKQDSPTKKKVEKEVKKVDVYDEMVKLEMNESSERTSGDDDILFKAVCTELRDLLKELYTLKMAKGDKEAIREKRVEASLLFVKMKKLNRLEKLRMRTAREKTGGAKQKVDEYNLQLQNLRYEVLHLKKEVSRCVNFWSADQSVTMVDVNTFYADAPEDISKPAITKVDLHQQRLARLAWELETRKKLNAQAQDKEELKTQDESVVNKKEDKLKDLGKQLQNILRTTRPVQESLNLELDKNRNLKSKAIHLPDPLYILFSQADGYCKGVDQLMSVEISGDIEEAKDFRLSKEKIDGEASPEVKRKQLLCPHPLSVLLNIKNQAGDLISLSFFYLVGLDIVTVQGKVVLATSVFNGDVLEFGSVMNQLYEGDEGLHSPNLKNEYQLKNAGISGDAGKLIREFGSPFVWAQRLAGLNFLSGSGADKSISFLHMPKTIQAIRKRLCSRVKLQEHLSALEQSKRFSVDKVPASIVDRYPLKLHSKLKSWAPITWEKYSQHTETSSLCTNGVVDSTDLLFKGVLHRGVATLSCLVSLKQDYPASSPVFCLSLQWKEKWAADNNEWIRDLEKKINCDIAAEDKNDDLLIHQVYRLMVLMDVFLEAVSTLDSEPVFIKEKPFKTGVTGRERKLPLNYNKEENIFY